MTNVITVVAAIGVVAVSIWFVRVLRTGFADRAAEEEAREFFDRHGRWPDEHPPDQEREQQPNATGADPHRA